MPTYEYRCKDCGHELETVQAFSDDALTTCPVCHAEALRKVFGSVGIAFKGSGFYKNDSRGKTSSTSAASSSTSSTSGDGGTSNGSKDSSSSSSDSPATTTPASKPASSSDAKSA